MPEGDAVADTIPLQEPDWAPAAMRERLARVETIGALSTKDIATLRERSHDLANSVQKLIGEIGGIGKMVEHLTIAMDAQVKNYGAVSAELASHVMGCQADAAEARGDRLSFRREMRKYMITILTTLVLYIVGAILSGKLHISFTGS